MLWAEDIVASESCEEFSDLVSRVKFYIKLTDSLDSDLSPESDFNKTKQISKLKAVLVAKMICSV